MLPLDNTAVYIERYGLFRIFVPVYCFLFVAIPFRALRRLATPRAWTAKIQWALFICIYCTATRARGLRSRSSPGMSGRAWKLLVFLVVVVRLSDVLQYVWGKLLGRHKIAPHLSPNKTWEGFLGGVLTATAIGAALTPITPFNAGRLPSSP